MVEAFPYIVSKYVIKQTLARVAQLVEHHP